MADNKVSIEISLEGNAQVQFKKLGDSAQDFATQTKKGFLDAGRIFDNFIANIASNAVTGAFNVIKSGISSFTDLLDESIKASSEQEDAINKLNSALKISGQYTSSTSKELQDYASALQSTTKYGDETILSTTALISSLGQLDKEGLKKATAATLDLATATGIDLNTAAQLVGKAAAGEVSTLKRYGVEVKDTGDRVRDFSTALEKINKQFGGSAASQIDTFSGAVAQLKNNYGDTLEVIGDYITQSPVVIAGIRAISDEVVNFTKSIKESKEASSGLSTILLALTDITYAVVRVSRDFYTIGLQITRAFTLAESSLSLFTNAVTLGFTDAGKRFRESHEEFERLGKAIDEANDPNKFTDLEAAILRVRNALQDATNAEIDNAAITSELRAQKIQQAADDEVTQEARSQNAILSQENEQNAAQQSYANYLIARNATLAKYNDESSKQQIKTNNEALQRILNSDQSSVKTKLQLQDHFKEQDLKIEQERAAAKIGILNNLATLQNAKTKELAVVGKAAAISATTIATYKGATEAYAALAGIPVIGPALAIAAAAAAITAGLANVASIAGTPLATGIDSVPPGFQNDTFPARLSSGERVVSAPQNKDLTEFLSGSSGLSAKLDQLIGILATNGGRTVVSIDGREIVTAIQDQIDSGRALNV